SVLDFISKYLLAGPKRPVRMSPLEQYRGEKTGTPTAAVGVPVQTFIQKVYQRIGAKAENNNVKEAVPKISGLLAHLMHAKHELKANFCETRSSVSARVSSAD